MIAGRHAGNDPRVCGCREELSTRVHLLAPPPRTTTPVAPADSSTALSNLHHDRVLAVSTVHAASAGSLIAPDCC